MIIRPERPDDADRIRGVHAAAFPAPPDGGNVPPEVGIVEALRSHGDLVLPLCLVADLSGEIVGHVTVSRATPDGLLALGPVAVVPSARGRGIGTALVHSVVAAAEALWYVGVVLLGDPTGCERFGFEPAEQHGLVPGRARPPETLLVRPLPSSWPGAYPPGTVVRYPAAFTELT